MESVSIKDPGGIGKWMMISGCPLPEKHPLFDPAQDLSGPTFAVCACCEFQKGRNFQIFDARGDFPVAAYPGLLRCGYSQRKTIVETKRRTPPIRRD